MGLYHRFTLAYLAFLLFTSVSALGFNQNHGLSIGVKKPREEVTHRRLIAKGPGSSPPTCRSKCARCAPCKPVRVPIPPGWSLTLEYYPEVWRCKCGDKLFMP